MVDLTINHGTQCTFLCMACCACTGDHESVLLAAVTMGVFCLILAAIVV